MQTPLSPWRKFSGFTLAEIAVVVLVISIGLSMGLKMLAAQAADAALKETISKQDRVKLALVAFFRTNGRLPCPDTAAGVATGVAAAVCTNAAGTSPALAPLGYGVLPWITLGLSRNDVIDGYGNFFTYAVANRVIAAPVAPPANCLAPNPPPHINANQNWTIRPVPSPAALTGFDIRSLNGPTLAPCFQTITITDGDALPAPTVISRNAIAVILSHGANGFGAKTPKAGPRIAVGGAGADEIINGTVGSTAFIRRAITEAAVLVGGPSDDVLTFLAPRDLIQPMINEGTLRGACRVYCAAPAALCSPNLGGITIGISAPAGIPQLCP